MRATLAILAAAVLLPTLLAGCALRSLTEPGPTPIANIGDALQLTGGGDVSIAVTFVKTKRLPNDRARDGTVFPHSAWRTPEVTRDRIDRTDAP